MIDKRTGNLRGVQMMGERRALSPACFGGEPEQVTGVAKGVIWRREWYWTY